MDAQQLADWLQEEHADGSIDGSHELKAAAMLRKQAEAIKALRETLEEIPRYYKLSDAIEFTEKALKATEEFHVGN